MCLTAAAAFLAYTVVCMCMSVPVAVFMTMRANIAIFIFYDMHCCLLLSVPAKLRKYPYIKNIITQRL